MTLFLVKRAKVFCIPDDVYILWCVGDDSADTLLYSEIVLFSPFVRPVYHLGGFCFVKKERAFLYTSVAMCKKNAVFFTCPR